MQVKIFGHIKPWLLFQKIIIKHIFMAIGIADEN